MFHNYASVFHRCRNTTSYWSKVAMFSPYTYTVIGTPVRDQPHWISPKVFGAKKQSSCPECVGQIDRWTDRRRSVAYNRASTVSCAHAFLLHYAFDDSRRPQSRQHSLMLLSVKACEFPFTSCCRSNLQRTQFVCPSFDTLLLPTAPVFFSSQVGTISKILTCGVMMTWLDFQERKTGLSPSHGDATLTCKIDATIQKTPCLLFRIKRCRRFLVQMVKAFKKCELQSKLSKSVNGPFCLGHSVSHYEHSNTFITTKMLAEQT